MFSVMTLTVYHMHNYREFSFQKTTIYGLSMCFLNKMKTVLKNYLNQLIAQTYDKAKFMNGEEKVFSIKYKFYNMLI